jgi:hypothetical protein
MFRMLTHGKGCDDGMLCSPKLSEVKDGDAVFPKTLAREITNNLGDIPIDCLRMPGEAELRGHEVETVNRWLENVSQIRRQQQRLFDYLLTNHPTDFTFFVQSCEDRVGHWLYPIQPHNAGYNPSVHSLRVDAFPNQYREFDKAARCRSGVPVKMVRIAFCTSRIGASSPDTRATDLLSRTCNHQPCESHRARKAKSGWSDPL